jgi:hypothetical protein
MSRRTWSSKDWTPQAQSIHPRRAHVGVASAVQVARVRFERHLRGAGEREAVPGLVDQAGDPNGGHERRVPPPK